MPKPKPVPHTTVVRYAVDPGCAGSIEYVDGMQHTWPKLPEVNAVLTVPFLVDPQTRQPVPVRVLRIEEMLHLRPPILAVVVGRLH
jgi:hypothetical protein